MTKIKAPLRLIMSSADPRLRVEVDEELGNYVMPFGKFNGTPLLEIDPWKLRSYYEWLCKQQLGQQHAVQKEAKEKMRLYLDQLSQGVKEW